MSCVDFAEAKCGGINLCVLYCHGESYESLKDSRLNPVGRLEDLPSDATQQRRIGANLFQVEQLRFNPSCCRLGLRISQNATMNYIPSHTATQMNLSRHLPSLYRLLSTLITSLSSYMI